MKTFGQISVKIRTNFWQIWTRVSSNLSELVRTCPNFLAHSIFNQKYISRIFENLKFAYNWHFWNLLRISYWTTAVCDSRNFEEMSTNIFPVWLICSLQGHLFEHNFPSTSLSVWLFVSQSVYVSCRFLSHTSFKKWTIWIAFVLSSPFRCLSSESQWEKMSQIKHIWIL